MASHYASECKANVYELLTNYLSLLQQYSIQCKEYLLNRWILNQLSINNFFNRRKFINMSSINTSFELPFTWITRSKIFHMIRTELKEFGYYCVAFHSIHNGLGDMDWKHCLLSKCSRMVNRWNIILVASDKVFRPWNSSRVLAEILSDMSEGAWE